MKEHSAIERYISQMEDYELYEKVDNVMDLYGYKPENLIQILHAAQTIFGCVPLELQRFIADSLDITLSEDRRPPAEDAECGSWRHHRRRALHA